MTRPEPGAAATASRVAAMGLVPVLAPILAVETLSADFPAASSLQAILVTSANAITALPPAWLGLPLLAVGEATARRARDAGFVAVESADGDSDDLTALVERRYPGAGRPLLLASGAGQGTALTEKLRARGFQVVRREVYAARPASALPDAALRALDSGSLRAALFFSAETARTFARLVGAAARKKLVSKVDALAIGPPAAVALRALPWRTIRVAARPTQDEMLALLR